MLGKLNRGPCGPCFISAAATNSLGEHDELDCVNKSGLTGSLARGTVFVFQLTSQRSDERVSHGSALHDCVLHTCKCKVKSMEAKTQWTTKHDIQT